MNLKKNDSPLTNQQQLMEEEQPGSKCETQQSSDVSEVTKSCEDEVEGVPSTNGYDKVARLSDERLDMPPQIFEDITEDEDEEEETFENIELELDDLIDPAEQSNNGRGGGKSDYDIQLSEVEVLDKEEALLLDTTEVNEPSETNNVGKHDSVNEFDMDLLSDDPPQKLENVPPNSIKEVRGENEEHSQPQKQKVTARKSYKPVTCAGSELKTIDLHPIKNITMKLADVQEALDCDPLQSHSRDSHCKTSAEISDADLDLPRESQELNADLDNKLISLNKNKRKSTGDEIPPGKRKAKPVKLKEFKDLRETAECESSPGSINSKLLTLPQEDSQDGDSATVSQLTSMSECGLDSSSQNSTPVISSTSSSVTSPPSSRNGSSDLQKTSVKSKPSLSKANSKMTSVLDMLHARNKQKAALEQALPAPYSVQDLNITPDETVPTTAQLLSPLSNKPNCEGFKRKGTPRKRRDDVICLSDSEDSGDKKLVFEGKRKKDTAEQSVTSSSVPAVQHTKQKVTNNITTAPVVMVVAQHSSTPGLRSLLPRQTSSPADKHIKPVPGGVISSIPLISSLPLGAKGVSLPPGMTAVPVTPLPPGSQSAMTFFTAVPHSLQTAMPIPISGANLLSITSPVQLVNNVCPGRIIKTTSSSSTVSTSLPSPKLSNGSSGPNNSDSLRALLVGKPYKFPIMTSAGSSQLTSTPMLLQMVTSTSANLIPVSADHPSLASTTTAPSVKKPSAVNKSNYSLIKPQPPAVPNGLSCLTPPKTPDTDSSSEVLVAATMNRPVAGQVEDSEVIPLCCCKLNGASLNKVLGGSVVYCQALDSVDNKVLGCNNKVTNPQLVRPGVKIPFMAVCEAHHKRLKQHQCCPGCGQFCTQGRFQQCKKDDKSPVHTFHKLCLFYRGGKYYCPHCGGETVQEEVELRLSEKPEDNKITSQRISKREAEKRTARICYKNFTKCKSTSEGKSNIYTLSNNKTINLDALPLGPDHNVLTKLCRCLNEDRPKKYRTLSKDLYSPACEGELERVFFLLVDGMDVNSRYEVHDDQTALHAAAYSGSIGTIFILTQFGAEVHAQDKNLRTPVMCAAESGNLKAVQFLIKAGAKVEDRGEDGMTSLHYAAKAGFLDIVQHIVETGKVQVNVQDDGGWTPIMWATELQMPDVVKYLLTQGGDPSKKDNEENTSLHWAAFSGSLAIAEMFLDRGCEVDAVNEHGDRPLHIAARQDHYDMIVLLLARGADVTNKNNKNESPVESCTNKAGQTWMALKVNQQLRSFASWKLIRSERLVERDMTLGRERYPVACVNSEDSEACPVDYLYVTENVETSPLNINNVITSLQSCRCKDDCSSMYCVCGRSSIKCWYDKMGRLLDEVNLLEPPLVFECNRACRCWVNCNNRVVQNGITCRLQMFRTNGRGWGVRPLMDIPKGTFVCEYIGELISDSEADRREDDSYLFDLDNKDGDTYCIDARRYGNISRFINHLCEPNLVPVKVFVEHQDLRFPRICLFSSREIKAYEELGFDYGEKFWIIKWKQFTCACKSARCKYSSETITKTLHDYKLRYPDENVDF